MGIQLNQKQFLQHMAVSLSLKLCWAWVGTQFRAHLFRRCRSLGLDKELKDMVYRGVKMSVEIGWRGCGANESGDKVAWTWIINSGVYCWSWTRALTPADQTLEAPLENVIIGLLSFNYSSKPWSQTEYIINRSGNFDQLALYLTTICSVTDMIFSQRWERFTLMH